MKNKSSKSKKIKTSVRKAADRNDITELMLRDHKPLKRLIKTMKSEDAELPKIRAAFEEFAPLLEAHAKPEQESLYTKMIEDKEEMRVEGFEGETEHSIADRVAKEIKETEDEDQLRARIKVLAELVEHHIEEEEEDMIPDLRKDMDLDERVAIGQEYLRRREKFGIESKVA